MDCASSRPDLMAGHRGRLSMTTAIHSRESDRISYPSGLLSFLGLRGIMWVSFDREIV